MAVSEDYFFDTEQTVSEKKVFVLVIYDIIENKKRVKLAKLLLGYGFRIQKSAFEAELSEKKYEKLLEELRQFEDEEDSIRIYRISGRGQVTVIGKDDSCTLEDIIII